MGNERAKPGKSLLSYDMVNLVVVSQLCSSLWGPWASAGYCAAMIAVSIYKDRRKRAP